MKYNLAEKKEVDEALMYFTKLVGKEVVVEIKEVQKRRSLNQNAYLHLLLGIYSLDTGYRLAESKVIYKRDANPDIYVYKNKGMTFLKSSADLDKETMTRSIERFREFAREQDIHLPSAMSEEEQRSLENQMERNRHLL